MAAGIIHTDALRRVAHPTQHSKVGLVPLKRATAICTRVFPGVRACTITDTIDTIRVQ